MTNNVISPEDFEEARQAFAAGWEAEDDRQVAASEYVAGARSAAGLTEALRSLGIVVRS